MSSTLRSTTVQISWNMTRVLLAWVLTAILAFADEWKSAAPLPKSTEGVYVSRQAASSDTLLKMLPRCKTATGDFQCIIEL